MVINKYLAELVGTFILVFVGSLAIVASGGDLVVIAFGFGLALLAAIVALGDVSGGHYNPAVTLAMWLDKRIDTSDLIGYWIGQVVGGVLGSVGILIAADKATVAATYTGHGAIGSGSAFLLEAVLTAVFVLVVMTSTVRAPRNAAVATSMAFAAVYLASVPFTGGSANPARTLGPSIVGGVGAGLWVYVLAPLVGAAVAWLLYRLFHTEDAAA